MSSEHVEVLREMLDDAAIEPPWKPEEVAAITAAIASLSAPQPPAEAPPSAPVGVEGFPPDVQEIIRRDEAAWALAERAEAAGAERDSDDSETWWTLRIEQFYALVQQPAAVDELIHAARELRQRQRDYLSDPKDRRDENKGRLVGVAAARVDAALEALAQPGGSDNDR